MGENKASKKYMSREVAIERISQAALKVFSKKGYHGASIRSIAEESGLSKGLIYHYFPSKIDIFLHLNSVAYEKSKEILDRTMDLDLSSWEKIERVAKDVVQEVLTMEYAPYFLLSLQSAIEASDIPEMASFVAEKTSHFKDFEVLIEGAQQDGDAVQGDPDFLSSTFLSLIQGLALMLYQTPEISKKITSQSLTNLLRNNQI